jgi:hypothetical protein
MQTQTFLVTVDTDKPVANLPQLIGARIWTITGVTDTAVTPVHLGAAGQVVLATGPTV